MHTEQTQSRPVSELSDSEIISELLNGATRRFELLMRRYNQRLYRVARSMSRDAAEADDIAQEAWVQAYANLLQFAGAASFVTWACTIAAHEAQRRYTCVARTDGATDTQAA